MFSINILTIDLVFFSAISNQIDSLQFPEDLHFKEIFQRLEKHFVKKRQPNSMLKCVHWVNTRMCTFYFKEVMFFLTKNGCLKLLKAY